MDQSAKRQQYEATTRKHGDPIRVLAESAIPRYFGELTGDAKISQTRRLGQSRRSVMVAF